MLECNQALQDGKPRPRPRLKRGMKPSCPELQIKAPLQAEILLELRAAWAGEQDKNKERVIAQFKEPITKNRQLTAYQSNSYSHDDYESDFTANTQNSEGTFVFQADTEFNANTNVNSNRQIEGTNDLTVNAAVLKSIIR